MSNVLKEAKAWPFTFGGDEHTGWLPPGAITPPSTPTEPEFLDITIEQSDGGYLLIWNTRLSATCRDSLPPKAGDTWHMTLHDAEKAAELQFGIRSNDWTDVNGEG